MEDLKGRAKYIAGGTDIIVRIKQRAIQTDALISLSGIEALKDMSHNRGLSLGGMTTFRQVETDRVIARDYPSLARAVSVLANPQIRNVATVGGKNASLGEMIKADIRHLPVVVNNQIAGMLTISDLVKYHVGELTAELHYLQDYITDLHDAV